MKRFITVILMSLTLISLCSAQTFDAEKISRQPSLYRHTSPSFSRAVTETFFDIFIDFWIMETILVTFDDYPYCSGNYIKFDGLNEALGLESENSEKAKRQFYRFALDTSIFYFPNRMIGNQTRIEGLIWKFFGPIFQIDTGFKMSDNADKLALSSLNLNSQLGVQFSIVQTNPLSLYWAMCWERIQYEGNPVLNGISFQLIARSYPVSPLLLEWRGTIFYITDSESSHYNDFNWESHLELGIMVKGPLEVFAAWRYFSYLSLGRPVNGVEIGARYHF